MVPTVGIHRVYISLGVTAVRDEDQEITLTLIYYANEHAITKHYTAIIRIFHTQYKPAS